MGMSINRVILTGNCVRDAEIRNTPSGLAICTFSIAVNGRAKVDGEWTDRAEFVDCTLFGDYGAKMATYLVKGKPIAVDGRLRQERWQDKDSGKNRSRIVINVDSLQLLGSKGDGQGQQSSDSGRYGDAPPAGSPAQPSGGSPDIDSIPFAHDGFPDYEERRVHAHR